MEYRLFWFLAGLILFGALEFLQPRAPLSQPRKVRWAANLGFALLNAAALRTGIGAAFLTWVMWVEGHQYGVLAWTAWPLGVRIIATVVILDFSFYVFHYLLMHRWQFGWRFHLVHHTDLDLDVTSASRFHLGELIISMIYTSGVVWLIGPPLVGVVVYEAAKLFAAQFNHSRLRLPPRFERALGWIFVTPAIHWLHHSWEWRETNSNFANIFSVWDRLFRTYRGEADHQRLVLGLKEYRDGERLRALPLFALPFTKLPAPNQSEKISLHPAQD